MDLGYQYFLTGWNISQSNADTASSVAHPEYFPLARLHAQCGYHAGKKLRKQGVDLS